MAMSQIMILQSLDHCGRECIPNVMLEFITFQACLTKQTIKYNKAPLEIKKEIRINPTGKVHPLLIMSENSDK